MAFGSRMRRITEALIADIVVVYERLGVGFNPKWFPLVTLLRRGPVGVVEAANTLGLTHPAVSQFAKELTEAGLVTTVIDARDERRRLLHLSESGLALCRELEPLWQSVESAVASLQRDAGVDLLDTLDRLEAAHAQASMTARTVEAYRTWLSANIELGDIRPEEFTVFRDLNLAWIRASFRVEPADQKILGAPQANILDRGGVILVARLRAQVRGVVALIPVDRHTLELSKMAVDARLRGLGVGTLLLDAAITRARARGERTLILETSSKLTEAIALYERAGFVRRPPPAKADYARTDTWMTLDLS